MKLETKIKQIIVALVGNCILGVGVAFESLPLLGTDPAVSFSQAAAPHLGITIGQMITVTNMTLLLITFIVKRKNIGIATFIVVFLNQYPVDFVTNLVPRSEYLVINILYILIGILLISIGCCTIMASKLGMGIYDAFVYGIADRINKSFLIVRYSVDSLFLILTIILKGYVGIGTILPYLLLGGTINFLRPRILKLIKFD